VPNAFSITSSRGLDARQLKLGIGGFHSVGVFIHGDCRLNMKICRAGDYFVLAVIEGTCYVDL
jgi:hypothetical protein